MSIEQNRGYKFYNEVLKSPKLIVAPMVDQSELPFRELCRKFGAQLCYTPMIAARNFVKSLKLREEYLYKCSFDRPLICQFCVNDPDILIEAIGLAKDYCDAIDINLGCPQNIARRGHYGAFLQDDWTLISTMIEKAIQTFPDMPITCKIRVFDDEQRTIEYAKMIEKAGCYLLTVHGRTREMKGQFTGLADWNKIKRVKEELKIPVFANGNIQRAKDVEDCLQYTGVDGVMSAEGLLYNPALFKALHIPSWIMIDNYLEICRTTSIISNIFIKAHLFKIAQLTLQMPEYKDLRSQLSKSFKIEQFQEFSNELRKKFELNENQVIEMTNYPLPHYVTQAYFRPPNKLEKHVPNESEKSKQDHLNEQQNRHNKHKINDETIENVETNDHCSSKKQKLTHLSGLDAKKQRKAKLLNCTKCCAHQRGVNCENTLCKPCCRKKCFESDPVLSCRGHNFNVRKIAKNSIKTDDQVDLSIN